MPAPDKTVPVKPDNVPEQPTREISQVDHINKKLLTSLFQRMDEGGETALSKMLEDDDNKTEEQEWTD